MQTHPSGQGHVRDSSCHLSFAGWLEQRRSFQSGVVSKGTEASPAHLHMPQEGSLGVPRLCLHTTDHPARDGAASAASTQVLQHFKPPLKSHSAGDVSQKIFQQRRGK